MPRCTAGHPPRPPQRRAASLAWLLWLVLLLVLPTQALASVTTAGTIKGTTVDEGGLPIPGVLVTISSPNLMGVRQMATDPEGRFLFIDLPPGTYALKAEKEGFATVTKPNLLVQIGHSTILTVEMPLKTASEEMVVEDTRPVIDTESANQGTVLTKEFLQRIPAGRSYQSATQLAPGVTGGSNPNVSGSGRNENTYLLDGVNITDPVTGTFSLNFNFDAIEQIEVLTSAFDPEYGINLGGSINIVTSSGGNTLESNTGVYYMNGNWAPKLDSRYAADGTELAPTDFDSEQEEIQISNVVSGPIVRDKAWFITSYQYERTLYSFSGVVLPRDFDGHYVLAKLTWQPSTAHRFTALFQTNPTTIDNIDQSKYVKPEAQGRQAQGGFVSSLQWDWFIGANAFLESKALVQKEYIDVYGVPCTHNQSLGYNPCEPTEPENTIDFTTPARIGINNAYSINNYGFFYFDNRWRASLDNKFSLLQIDFAGTHDVKVGVEGDYLLWNQIQGFSGNIEYIDLNYVQFNPDSLNNYYWVEVSQPLAFSTNSQHLGTFIQDVYKPVENLTFRYGLRYDRTLWHDDVGNTLVNIGLWGPRFSAIWDPWSNGKTKLVGSMGRFNDTGRMAVASYLFRSDFGFKLFLGEYFDEFTSSAANDYAYSPIQNTNTIYDKTIAPYADEFSFGAERELVRDLAARLYFTGKYTRNLYAFDEQNFIWDNTGYNIIGTSNGQFLSYYRLRTPNDARRDYYRVDFGFKKVWSDRWEGEATYSLTSSRGTVQTAPSSFLSVPQQLDFYKNGYLGTDIEHQLKSGVAWDVPDDPWTTKLGSTVYLESGYPLSRYYPNAFYGSGSILKQTLGTYGRSRTWYQINLLVQQAIPVRKGKLWGILEVDNLTNNRVGRYPSLTYDNRWIVAFRETPINLQVGAKYEF